MRALIVAAAAFVLSAPALAQEGASEEIVVTAARYHDAYESFVVPNVAQVRRADFAVQDLTITSDTRDATARRQELRQALQSLTRFADRNARVSVALVQEDADETGASRVVNFTVEKAMASLRNAGRPDTEQVTLAIRTRVTSEDNLDAVDDRFDAFASAIPKPGRIEIGQGAMELTLNDPQQYRAPLITAIAADAARISTALGTGYGARLEGLENPVAWRRAGDLDLRLFVPYRMIILPRNTAG